MFGVKFRSHKHVLYGCVIIVALTLRFLFINHVSIDMAHFNLKWVDFIRHNGYFWSLGKAFYNYNPPYMYLLTIAAAIPTSPVITIKCISFVFDLFAAILAKLIIQKYTNDEWKHFLSFTLVLLSPIVWVDSAIWGQNDIIYSSFLILCFYLAIIDKPLYSLIFFAVAFGFKAQAIFLAPWVAVLLLLKRIHIKDIFIIPIIFVLMITPVVFAGRSYQELFTIYFGQFGSYTRLSMNAPNMYIFFPEELYKPLLSATLIISAVFILISILVFSYSQNRGGKKGLLSLAVFYLFFIPFILPKMHDRYFFPAAVFAIPLAVIKPRTAWLALSLQVSSLLAFIPFLTETAITWPVKIGALINTAALAVYAIVLLMALFPEFKQKMFSKVDLLTQSLLD